MAKVGVKLGMTLRLFKDQTYEFIRPEVSIDEIDTDLPIKPQLEASVKALKETWDEATNQVSELVLKEMPQVTKEMELQIGKQLKDFRKEIDSLKKIISDKNGK